MSAYTPYDFDELVPYNWVDHAEIDKHDLEYSVGQQSRLWFGNEWEKSKIPWNSTDASMAMKSYIDSSIDIASSTTTIDKKLQEIDEKVDKLTEMIISKQESKDSSVQEVLDKVESILEVLGRGFRETSDKIKDI